MDAMQQNGRGGDGVDSESRHRAGLATTVALLLLAPALLSAQDLPTRPEEWIQRYGVLDPDSTVAGRAAAVFARVVAAADWRGSALPSLLLVPDLPDHPIGFAAALPGGTVVVDQQMLELCLLGARGGQEVAEARLAHVLAHELAHLAFDSGHRAYFSAARFESTETAAVLEEMETWEHVALEEREAEFYGLHFLLAAGFDAKLLLADGGMFWEQMLRGRDGLRMRPSKTHPSPKERVELVRTQLRGLLGVHYQFAWGTRLLQLGRYQDATQLLEEYKLSFAGAEVLNNLGIAHHLEAERILADCDGRLVVRFYLPLITDAETVRERTRLRGGERSPCYDKAAYRHHMERARQALEVASRMLPTYPTARLNLASTLMLDDKGSQAFLAAKEGLDLDGSDPLARTAYSVALYRMAIENGLDQEAAALVGLDEVVHDHPGLAYPYFNQARILSDLGRHAAAWASWLRFASLEQDGPWADYARERIGLDQHRTPLEQRECAVPPPALPLGEIDYASLGDWQRQTPKLRTTRYESLENGAARALAINGTVEIVEQPMDEAARAGVAACGAPLRVSPTAQGRILHFANVAVEERVGQPDVVVYLQRASEHRLAGVSGSTGDRETALGASQEPSR